MAAPLKSSRDVIIRTQSAAEAWAFYEGVLGFRLKRLNDTVVGFETGSFTLYVEKGPAHGPVFDFLTYDVPSTRDRLVKAGCVVLEEDPSVQRCYLRDPFGVVFNVGEA